MSIQQVSGQATGALSGNVPLGQRFTITYPKKTTSGNTLLLVVSQSNPQSIAISDNFGNAWKLVGYGTVQMYVCEDCRGGAGHQVYITPQMSNNYLAAVIDEFFGAAQGSEAGQSNVSNGGTLSVGPLSTPSAGLVIAAISRVNAGYWNNPSGYTVDFNSPGTAPCLGYCITPVTGAQMTAVWTQTTQGCSGAMLYLGSAVEPPAEASVSASAGNRITGQAAAPRAQTAAGATPAVTHNVAHGGGSLATAPNVIASGKAPATARLSATAQIIASEKAPASASTRATASAAVHSNSAKGESHTGASANVQVTHNRTDANAGLRASGVMTVGAGRIAAAPETIASSLVDSLARLQTALKLVTNAANIALAGAVHSAGSAGPPAAAKISASPALKSGGLWKLIQQTDAATGTSAVNVTFSSPVQEGNLVIVLALATANVFEEYPTTVATGLATTGGGALNDGRTAAFHNFGSDYQAGSGLYNNWSADVAVILGVAGASGPYSFGATANDSVQIVAYEWQPPSDILAVSSVTYPYTPPQSLDQVVTFTGVNYGDAAFLFSTGEFYTGTSVGVAYLTGSAIDATAEMFVQMLIAGPGESSLGAFVVPPYSGENANNAAGVLINTKTVALTTPASRMNARPGVDTDAANVSLSEHLSAAATKLLLSQVTHSESSLGATAFVSPGQAVEASIAAALRLIASSLYATAGRIAASAGPQVTRNLASGESRGAATASELVSQVTATEGAIHASAGLTSSNIENVVSRVVASPAVLAGGVYHAAAGISAAPLLRTSSRYQARAALAAVGQGRSVSGAGRIGADALVEVTAQFVHVTAGVATELKTIASQVVSASSEFSAAGHPHVATNVARLIEHAAGLASVVNHTSALAAGSLSSHAAERVASNLANAATSVAGASVEIAKTSKSQPRATGGAVATVVASNPLRATTTTRARATLFASGQHVAAEAALAFDGVPRSSGSVHPLAEVRLDAIVLASGVKTIVSGVRAQLATIASSLTAAAVSVSNRARAGVTKNVARPVSITAADAAQTVPHNAASVQTRADAAASNRVPYNVARVSPTTAASAQPRVTENSCGAAEHVRASGVLDVLENHVAALETLALKGAAIAAHNVADVSSRLRADAEQIVSQIVAALADLTADAQEHALHNLAHGQASLDALADLVNRTARAVEGGVIAAANPINHEFLALAEHLESLAEAIANTGSTGGSEGRGGAFATVIASSLFGGEGGIAAHAAVSSPNRQFPVSAWTWVQPRYNATAMVVLA